MLLKILQTILDLIFFDILYYFLYKKWKAEQKPVKLYTCFYCSILFIFLLTLSPILWNIPQLFAGHDMRFGLIPFNDAINEYGYYRFEITCNILLFVPFGYFFTRITGRPTKDAWLSGLCLSIFIEFFQPFLSHVRVCDITDVITNSFGAFLGGVLYYLFHK